MAVELAFNSRLSVVILEFSSVALISLQWRWDTNVTWCQTCILLGNAFPLPCNSRSGLVCKNSLARLKLDSTRLHA